MDCRPEAGDPGCCISPKIDRVEVEMVEVPSEIEYCRLNKFSNAGSKDCCKWSSACTNLRARTAKKSISKQDVIYFFRHTCEFGAILARMISAVAFHKQLLQEGQKALTIGETPVEIEGPPQLLRPLDQSPQYHHRSRGRLSQLNTLYLAKKEVQLRSLVGC